MHHQLMDARSYVCRVQVYHMLFCSPQTIACGLDSSTLVSGTPSQFQTPFSFPCALSKTWRLFGNLKHLDVASPFGSLRYSSCLLLMCRDTPFITSDAGFRGQREDGHS